MPKAGIIIKRIDGENPILGNSKVRFFIEYPDGKVKRLTKDGSFSEINVGDTVITSWSLLDGWTVEKVARVR